MFRFVLEVPFRSEIPHRSVGALNRFSLEAPGRVRGPAMLGAWRAEPIGGVAAWLL